MSTLLITKKELEAIRKNESKFIVEASGKDRTITKLRPSHHKRTIQPDQETFNFIVDTLETLVPLANKNGTPITLSLIASVLGIPRQTLQHVINKDYYKTLTAEAEIEYSEKISNYLADTLMLARTDVESLRLARKIDPKSAGEVIDEIDVVLNQRIAPQPVETITSIKEDI